MTLARVPPAALALAWCAVACLGEPTSFGKPCTDITQCRDLLCVDGRCVPPRGPDFAGNSCADPLLLPRDETIAPDDPLIGSIVTPWGDTGAGISLPAACSPSSLPEGERGAVVFELRVTEPSALRATARMVDRLDARVALAVVPLIGETCGAPIVDGCAWTPRGSSTNDVELLVPRLDPTVSERWGLVVISEDGVPGVLEVTAEHLDCPVGFLPLDETTCGGFREVEPMQLPRVGGELASLGEGRAAYIGGFHEESGAWRREVELFEAGPPGTSSASIDGWSFDELTADVPVHFGAALLEDGGILVLGTDVDGAPVGEVFVPRRLGAVFEDPRIAFNEVRDALPSVGDLRLLPMPGGVYVAGDGLASLLEVTRLAPSCTFGLCPSGRTCAETADGDAVCVCTSDPCPAAGQYSVEDTARSGDATPASTAGARQELFTSRTGAPAVLLVSADQIQTHEPTLGAVRVVPPQPAQQDENVVGPTPRDFAAVASLGGSRVLVSGGQRGAPPTPTALIEVIDAPARPALVVAAELPSPRVAPTSTALPGGVLIAGGCEDPVDDIAQHPPPACERPLDDAVWLDTTQTVDGLAVVRLPRLPTPMAHHSAVALDDTRVLLAGTSSGESFVFERVPRRRDREPPPLGASCGVVEELVFDDDGHAEVSGDTNGYTDQLREEECEKTEGPDATYRFTTDVTSWFRARVTATSAAGVVGAWVWDGVCGDTTLVACGTPDLLAPEEEGAAVVEVLTLPPGEHFLVVEADQGFAAQFVGAPFHLEVDILPTDGTCPVDTHDPADDAPGGAHPLEGQDINDDEIADIFTADGVLCGDDTDHLLLEHFGGELDVALTGAAPGDASIMPTTIDAARTLETGVLAFTPLPEGAVPLITGDFTSGFYVIQLVGSAQVGAVTSWALSTRPACVPDPNDSVVPSLDDESRPETRTVLAPGTRLSRTFCRPDDVDIVELTLPPTDDIVVTLSDDAPAELRAIVADDALGAVVPTERESLGSLTSLRVLEEDRPARLALVLATTPSIGGGPIAVEVRTTGSTGDSCDEPLALAPPSGSAVIDLRLFFNDEDASFAGDCTGYESPGRDVVYRVDLGAGDTLTVDARPVDDGDGGANADVAVYLLDACPSIGTSCVAGTDVGFTLEPEHLVFTNPGPAGTFFLVVDSYYEVGHVVELDWSIEQP